MDLMYWILHMNVFPISLKIVDFFQVGLTIYLTFKISFKEIVMLSALCQKLRPVLFGGRVQVHRYRAPLPFGCPN